MSENDTDSFKGAEAMVLLSDGRRSRQAEAASLPAVPECQVAPTPANRPLSVRITNREQIERLTPAQKQKLMRIVIAKRKLTGKENNGGEPRSTIKPVPLEKRGSNQFPLPSGAKPKRQRTSQGDAEERAPLPEAQVGLSTLTLPLPFGTIGRIPPSKSALNTLQNDVRSMIHRSRQEHGRWLSKVHVKLRFLDGMIFERSCAGLSALFIELPKFLVNRMDSRERSNATHDKGLLIKHVEGALCMLYSTGSRRLMFDFKAQHGISLFEINGIDPMTLPPGVDMGWIQPYSAACCRVGIVDLRAFRAGKSLDECLFFATSGGQAFDMMTALRPYEQLCLTDRIFKRGVHREDAMMLTSHRCLLIKENEIVIMPLDLGEDVKEYIGFDYDAMKSLWKRDVSDDEKRGVLRCMSFHFQGTPGARF